MTGSAGLEFRTRAKIFNISIIRTPSPAYILKHRKNCERCPTQFPGKSSLKGNHIFPVCPVCPFCPVYPLCPVSPVCPDKTSCLSYRSSLYSLTCLWYFSPERVAKWLAWKVSVVVLFVMKLEVVHKQVGGCLISYNPPKNNIVLPFWRIVLLLEKSFAHGHSSWLDPHPLALVWQNSDIRYFGRSK